MVDRILELMKEKGLTASQFADEIGVQRSAMSHLVSGRNKPSLEFVMKVLARFPEVSPGSLLYGTREAGPNIVPPPVSVVEDNDRIVSPLMATLFDQPEAAQAKNEQRPQRQVKKERSDRKIEKIVVFYDDKTFREYEPE